MALPTKLASKLADSMAKNGLSGSISMGKTKAMPMKPPMDDGEEDGAMDSPDEDKSELDHCISETADAIASGDKAGIESALRDLIDCIKTEDEQEDKTQLGS